MCKADSPGWGQPASNDRARSEGWPLLVRELSVGSRIDANRVAPPGQPLPDLGPAPQGLVTTYNLCSHTYPVVNHFGAARLPVATRIRSRPHIRASSAKSGLDRLTLHI